MSEEFSFDLDEKSIKNIKEAIGLDEIEARHQRFMNGTETIDDLINGYRHYKICNDKGLDLDVVELKYYKRLIDFYKQAKSDLYEANNRINDLLDLVKQKDKIIDEMMKVIIDSEICKKIIKNHCVNYAGENKKTCDNCLKEYFEERCK